MTPGREALHRLIDEVLTVAPVIDNDGQPDRYRGGRARQVFDRMYGGQLLGQALIAAASTVRPGLEPNSVHGCFVAAGDPAEAVDFTVQRTGDSGGFARRIVFARQGAVVLATAMCSFHAPSGGFEHQQPPDPAPDPEDLVSRDVAFGERFGDDVPANAGANWPFDVRYIDRAPWGEGRSDGRNRLWMRAHDTVPDDQLLQRALLLYASDLAMFEPVVAPLDLAWEDLIAGRGAYGASLDHTVWFHRPVRVDDWLLEVQHSPIATGSRGLSIAQFYGRSGLLVATAVQEILVRAIGHESADVHTGGSVMTDRVFDWPTYSADRHSGLPAVTSVERAVTLTWGELEAQAASLAHVLRQAYGLRQGDRVALIAENDTRTFVLQFACMRAGLILVPLNWRLMPSQACSSMTEPGPASPMSSWRRCRRVAGWRGVTRRTAPRVSTTSTTP